MKKSILIALAVALATGAQAQVDEWVNPFKDYCEEHYADYGENGYGVYGYMQKKSERQIGKWFLITSYTSQDKWDKYPTLVNYNNETFVKINDCSYALAIILPIPQNFVTQVFNIDLKYNVIHLDKDGKKTDKDFLKCKVLIDKKQKDLFDKYDNGGINLAYFESIAEGQVLTTSGEGKYICIILSGINEGFNGYCLINNIEITIRDSDYNSGYDPNKKYFYKYFYEPYYMDNEGNIHSTNDTIQETPTTINDMESNTYVSNNVLHTDEPSSVYIFNAGGILVKTENNTTSVDLSDLKKGVYIAKVNEKTIKFVR